MKKIGVIRVFCLLIILCALLAGCGKKTPSTSPGGKKPSTPNSIQFLLPEDYYDPDKGSYYSIPKGSKVYFYLLTEDVNPEEIIEANSTFTGTIDGSILKFTLPDSLKDQKCYIYAVVEIDGSYDLKGKTITQAMEDADAGKILFGSVLNETGNQASPVTLTNNGTIGGFMFIGKGVGKEQSSIFFVMPENYLAGGTEHAIPANREVKFYSYTEFDDDTFKAEYIFSGTTGKERIRCTLPEELIGQTREFAAVIVLEGSFNLDGQKLEDIEKAVIDGKILLGSVEKDYLLEDGVEIDAFEFNGTLPNGVIRFEMPKQCVGTNTEIPSGKPVKFYAVTDTTPPLEPEYVFEGTTGQGIIELELPGWLMGEECYFMAIIVLKGDFDLEGKEMNHIQAPLENKEIMFGQAKEQGEEDNKMFELIDGVLIDSFQFIDIVPPKN